MVQGCFTTKPLLLLLYCFSLKHNYFHLSKSISSASGRDSPTTSVVRVRPEKITHGAFVWHFLKSVQRSDVVKGVYAWRQATMQAKYLTIHKGGQGKVIEQVSEIFPYIGIAVLAQALVIKPVNL